MGTTVEANNINIWYEEFGDKSNETILLIMGANANCMQWDQEFIDRLVANNFHVVRFDNRDVGKSTWFGKEPTLNKFLKLLPNFLLKIIVNSIFGLAVDDKGRFKFNNPNPEYNLSDMAQDAVALLEVLNIKKAPLGNSPEYVVVGMGEGCLVKEVPQSVFARKAAFGQLRPINHANESTGSKYLL